MSLKVNESKGVGGITEHKEIYFNWSEMPSITALRYWHSGKPRKETNKMQTSLSIAKRVY